MHGTSCSLLLSTLKDFDKGTHTSCSSLKQNETLWIFHKDTHFCLQMDEYIKLCNTRV